MKLLKLFSIIALILLTIVSCEMKPSIESSMLKAMEWQEANPIQAKTPTDWTNGAYYIGVVRAHQATKDQKYLDALTAMGNRNAWKHSERFYHADDLTICYSYLYMNSLGITDVNLQPTDTIIDEHLHNEHDWKNGTSEDEKKILWWWCDALFMTPPVLVEYAKLTSDESYLNQMHHYYTQTDSLLFDKEENLFARDLRFVWKGDSTDMKDLNGKKVFWSRGNGWVLGGLALILDDMPQDYENRGYYENLFKKMAARIKEIQPEDGLWRVSLLNPEGYEHGEVSGSGFFTFAMTWGINNGLLDPAEYKPVVLKAWDALLTCQQEDGKVGWVQNIGFDPKPADKDSWQNYGTGAFLLAGSEMLKLK